MSWLRDLTKKEPKEPVDPIGVILIGTLNPDMHQAPKEKVRKTLKKEGFKTVDMGRRATVQTYLAKIKEINPDILAISVNTTPAIKTLTKLIEALNDEGYKTTLPILVGGCAVDREDVESLGAIYGANEVEGLKIAKELMAQKEEK